MTPSARIPLAVYLLVQAGLLRSRKLHPVLAAHALNAPSSLRTSPPSCAAYPSPTSGCSCSAPWLSAMASSCRVAPPSTPS